MRIPKSHYVYEFSYPEEMPELAGIVFYIGKGTSLTRMDSHLKEAAKGCTCAKCLAIRSIWNTGLLVTRKIVFESRSECETLNEERKRITQHQSPYLTNIIRTESKIPERMPTRLAITHEIQVPLVPHVSMPQCKCGLSMVMCAFCRQLGCEGCDRKAHLSCRSQLEGRVPYDWI